jgi:hypothetical protein
MELAYTVVNRPGSRLDQMTLFTLGYQERKREW